MQLTDGIAARMADLVYAYAAYHGVSVQRRFDALEHIPSFS